VIGVRRALAAFVCATFLVSAFAGVAVATGASQPRPHDLKLYVNGVRRPGIALVGAQDDYRPVKNGKLNVVARWRTDAAGTGYRVVLALTEPAPGKTYASCSTGTACAVKKTVKIVAGQEMTWRVTVEKSNGKVVGGFLVCLVGRTT